MSSADVKCNVRSWSCFVVICLVWTLNGRAGQQQTEAEAITFDLRITAQSLDEALQEFSRQTGMQVIFFSSITEGIRSPGVAGKYTVAEALDRLLAGSGLLFRTINARTLEIREAAAPRQHEEEE